MRARRRWRDYHVTPELHSIQCMHTYRWMSALQLLSCRVELGRQRMRVSVCLTRTHLYVPVSSAFSLRRSGTVLLPGPWEGPPFSVSIEPFLLMQSPRGSGKQTSYVHLSRPHPVLRQKQLRLWFLYPTHSCQWREGIGLLSKAQPEVGLTAGPRHASP